MSTQPQASIGFYLLFIAFRSAQHVASATVSQGRVDTAWFQTSI
jgi:hypothetical protein